MKSKTLQKKIWTRDPVSTSIDWVAKGIVLCGIVLKYTENWDTIEKETYHKIYEN